MLEYINVAEYCKTTNALGPGNRFVLWVQGCPFSCKNCIAPDWIPFRPAKVFHYKELVDLVLSNPILDGITISGGEPMMQAEGIAKFLAYLKERTDQLSVILYTGYKINQLKLPAHKSVLELVDVLITGLYIESLNDGIGLRGSSNQEIVYLTNKHEVDKELFETTERSLEVHVEMDTALMIGVPPKGFTI